MAIDSTHHKAYVVHSGAEGTVSVVDLTTDTVTTTIEVGRYPFRVAVDEALDRAYVSNSSDQDMHTTSAIDTISEINTTTDTVVRTISGLFAPRGVAVDPTTHTLYAAEYLGGQDLAVIDPTTDPATIERTEILESRPWAVDVDPVRHRAYPTTLFGGTLSTVEGTTILSKTYGLTGPTNVTVDPATSTAYVVASNLDQVYALDLTDDDPTVTGPLGTTPGAGPSDVAVDPSTSTLFVTNLYDDTVSVLDRATGDLVATVPVGDAPVAVERDPATGRVYVLNGTARTISVIQAPVPQAITFTSTAPTDAEAGDHYTVTATGGGSGQPVTFSTDSTTCTVTPEGAVSLQHAGTCVVTADQAGAAEYLAAPPATQQVEVALQPTRIEVQLDDDDLAWDELAVAQTWSSDVPGLVQYYLDGEPYGEPQHVESPAGYTTLPDEIGSHVLGDHEVSATLTPTDSTTYATSTDSTTFTVSRIPTVTHLVLTPDALTATVSRAQQGYLLPTGSVRFFVAGEEVGDAPLLDGVATLAGRLETGDSRRVTAVFDDQDAFAGSTDSTARANPVITATRSSSAGSRHGWHRTPVTVTFHCRTAGAPLTAPCPARVTLSRSGADQTVTRMVMAQDGGVATVESRPVSIDRVRPTLRLTGVRHGATYFAGGPTAHCRVTDGLSGPAGCTVSHHRHGSRLVWVARATDRAGNLTTRRVVARSVAVWIDGARVRDGLPVVRAGRTYTVLVAATRRPHYVYAAPAPHRPYGGGVAFERIGKQRWALGVTFTRSMTGHARWNIGTRIGARTTVTTVRVVR